MEDKREMTAEEKKNFARDQLQFLKDRGVKSARRRSRIFKAAGPGQIQEAWRLAMCEDWDDDDPELKVRKDLLDCLLSGAGCVKFGVARMQAVLETCGFPTPQAHNGHQYFRILDGAMEILRPGSYDFTEEELQEIENGLYKGEDKNDSVTPPAED